MEEKIKKTVKQITDWWASFEPKRKKLMLIIVGSVVGVALLLTLALNFSGSGYTVLYPGITSTEASEVYVTLQDMGVPAKLSSKNEVLVPRKQKQDLLVQLSLLNYPSSAPNYGVYSSNVGLTTTESDRIVYLNAMLQDRLQETINTLSGVKSSIVTLVVSAENSYVWNTDKQSNSASVTITPASGKAPTAETVTAIKKLVSSAVPLCEPANVEVINATTGTSLKGVDEEQASGGNAFSLERFEYEAVYEQRMVDKVVDLLSNIYGAGKVQAAASITFDYDKMLTEQLQYVPEKDNAGVINHFEEAYTTDTVTGEQGVVGEEDNTEVPTYPTGDGNGDTTTKDYQTSVDYSVSQIKTLIERGQAPIKEATISVVVDDSNFTTETKDKLLDLVSKAVNVSQSNIAITNLTVGSSQTANGGIQSIPTWLIITAGSILLIIIIIVIILVAVGGKSKNTKEETEQERAISEAEKALASLRGEMEDHKRRLQEEALVASQSSTIANEVRGFAQENPEITASLIRAWMKEEE